MRGVAIGRHRHSLAARSLRTFAAQARSNGARNIETITSDEQRQWRTTSVVRRHNEDEPIDCVPGSVFGSGSSRLARHHEPPCPTVPIGITNVANQNTNS
jgi:hypothetical protein